MKTKHDWRATVYSAKADASERDPIGPDGVGRATVVNGRGFKKWQRFHPEEEVVWIEDADGKDAWITRKQLSVYEHVCAMADAGITSTMTKVAAELGVSVSTVSRTTVKLQAFGLIACLVSRGRYAGLLVVRRSKDDGLKRLREVAKARVRAWAKAAERRLARTKINLASMFTEKEWRDHGYHSMAHIHMDARLKKPWTVEELREAGII
jgi:DNA-binding MarR family transcriptional regulator